MTIEFSVVIDQTLLDTKLEMLVPLNVQCHMYNKYFYIYVFQVFSKFVQCITGIISGVLEVSKIIL